MIRNGLPFALRRLTGIENTPPVRAQARRPSAAWRHFNIKIQFPDQPCEPRPSVFLDAYRWVSTDVFAIVNGRDSFLVDHGSGLLRTVPRFGRKLQQPKMVPLQFEIGDDSTPPGLGLVAQVSRWVWSASFHGSFIGVEKRGHRSAK